MLVPATSLCICSLESGSSYVNNVSLCPQLNLLSFLHAVRISDAVGVFEFKACQGTGPKKYKKQVWGLLGNAARELL